MSGFVQALEFVLRDDIEGGYKNDPDDPGGPTNRGITQAVYDAYRRAQGRPLRSVREIERHEIEEIYFRDYWLRGKCEALLWPLSLIHFDSCTNHGVVQANKLLQEVVGVQADGIIGPKTLAAVADRSHMRRELCEDLLWRRAAFYAALALRRPDSRKFLPGWINRLVALRARAFRAG